ncbi:MAG: DNA primase [Streptosporangiales bacterium]|nr:DNA primase [Streptosporangiales bacterium]
MTPTTNATVNAALTAAGLGWHVFPLAPGSKRPVFRAWETHATTAPDRIRRYWTAHPRHGIGIACGPSGLLVIDIDRSKSNADSRPPEWQRPGITDGLDVLAAVCEQAGEPLPPTTYTVATPSGGRHLYFAQPAGTELRNTQGEYGGLGWLIDTRGHGGYVAAPGTTVSGRSYAVVDDGPVVDLPAWLVDKLTALAASAAAEPVGPTRLRTGHLSRYVDRAVRAEVAHVRAVQHEGGRNHALFMAAQNLGQLVAGGALDEATAREALLAAAADHLAAGAYTSREAHRTIASGLAAGARRPRRIEKTVAA